MRIVSSRIVILANDKRISFKFDAYVALGGVALVVWSSAGRHASSRGGARARVALGACEGLALRWCW